MTEEQALLPGMQRLQWPAPHVLRTQHDGSWRYVPTLVQTETQLADMVHACVARPASYDTETTGLHPALGCRIIGHCLAAETAPQELSAWYAPIRHIGAHNEEIPQLPVALVSEALRVIMAARDQAVYTHHAKFEQKFARADNIEIERPISDVAICAQIADENEVSFALKRLGEKYLFKGAQGDRDLLSEWMKKDARRLGFNFKKRNAAGDPTYLERFGYGRTPIYDCGAYGCMDAALTLLMARHYAWVWQEFAECTRRDHAVSNLLFEMEWHGLPADDAEIRRAHVKAQAEMEHWQERCVDLTGDADFSLSNTYLSDLLYKRLKFEVPKWTKAKQPGCDKEARLLLKEQYPEHGEMLDAINEAARAEKLRSTYTGSFIHHYSHTTGCIHPSYNQMEGRQFGGTPRTGRLSSADPNIQNISKIPLHLHTCDCEACPGGTGEVDDINIRRYFKVPPGGYVRAYVDFSQIELRVLAWFSRDPRLLECYANDLDVHQMTADTVTGGDRSTAKQVNFGNSYGMTEKGLSRRMVGYYQDPTGTEERAKQVLIDYFKEYAGIPKFKREFAADMKRHGCMCISPLGRPRRLPDLAAREQWKRERAERKMMSSIISGTAADLMKECMIRCAEILRTEDPESRMVQSIHDELVFDIRAKPGWSALLLKLIRSMEDWPMFSDAGVPIRTSCDLTTTTWADKRSVTVHPDGTFTF